MNLIVTTNPKLNNRYTETREKEHKHATEKKIKQTNNNNKKGNKEEEKDREELPKQPASK